MRPPHAQTLESQHRSRCANVQAIVFFRRSVGRKLATRVATHMCSMTLRLGAKDPAGRRAWRLHPPRSLFFFIYDKNLRVTVRVNGGGNHGTSSPLRVAARPAAPTGRCRRWTGGAETRRSHLARSRRSVIGSFFLEVRRPRISISASTGFWVSRRFSFFRPDRKSTRLNSSH